MVFGLHDSCPLHRRASLQSGCPKCHLLFTGEIIKTESLGSHVEVRKEDRVAQHYDPLKGGLTGETRYQVDVTEVGVDVVDDAMLCLLGRVTLVAGVNVKDDAAVLLSDAVRQA